MRALRCSLVLLTAALSLDGCAKTKPSPTPPPTGALSAQAPIAPIPVSSRPPNALAAPLTPPNVAPKEAMAAFDVQCGECHRSDLATANPKALAIFDLTHAGWLSRLTAEQLKVALHRFEGKSEAEKKDAMALLNVELTRR